MSTYLNLLFLRVTRRGGQSARYQILVHLCTQNVPKTVFTRWLGTFLFACKKKKGFTLASLYHHRFPLNDPELLKAWMEKLPCRDWKISRWSKLCSLHFADNCLYQLNNKTYLRQGSVPTVFSSPASKTKRSPRKRSRSQSDEAFLLCQRPKHRHRYEQSKFHCSRSQFVYLPQNHCCTCITRGMGSMEL